MTSKPDNHCLEKNGNFRRGDSGQCFRPALHAKPYIPLNILSHLIPEKIPLADLMLSKDQ